MNTEGFKIIKLSIYEDKIPEGEDFISRIMTAKGELAILATNEINFLAYCDFLKGKEPRGNHYHKEKVEYLYLCKGKIKVYIKKANDKNAELHAFEIESGTMVYIEPGYSHAVEAIEDSYGLEFSPTKYEVVKEDSFYEDIIS